MDTQTHNLSKSQQLALASLLADADGGTVELVKKELVQSGTSRLPEYQELMTKMSGRARSSLADVIRQIEYSDAFGNVSRGLAKLSNFSQLEDLCWELTRVEHAGFSAAPYRRTLDRWAADLQPLLPNPGFSSERVQVIAEFLGKTQRLIGNTLDYHHPRNCFLPWVIEFRCGLPITLTLVYILIGQRIGLPIQGISAPGHFLARLGDTIFDPYHGGRIVSDDEWQKILAELIPAEREAIMEPCTPLNMAHRLLINLRNSHVKRNDVEGRKRVDHYLAVIQR